MCVLLASVAGVRAVVRAACCANDISKGMSVVVVRDRCGSYILILY